MYSTKYLSTYPLCKKQLTAQYNVTVHRPGGQISFSKLFMIIICPLTFHILAFYNDWWSLIYSFKRPWSQSITIQMHAKLTTHSPHLCPPRGQKFFIKNFWDIIHIHIPTIFLMFFRKGGGGWVQSVHTSYEGYVIIELLTNYMYSTKYLPMYPLCISITSPDKGYTRSTPRGQYFSTKL